MQTDNIVQCNCHLGTRGVIVLQHVDENAGIHEGFAAVVYTIHRTVYVIDAVFARDVVENLGGNRRVKTQCDVVEPTRAELAVTHDRAGLANLDVLAAAEPDCTCALVDWRTVVMRVRRTKVVAKFMCHDIDVPVAAVVFLKRIRERAVHAGANGVAPTVTQPTDPREAATVASGAEDHRVTINVIAIVDVPVANLVELLVIVGAVPRIIRVVPNPNVGNANADADIATIDLVDTGHKCDGIKECFPVVSLKRLGPHLVVVLKGDVNNLAFACASKSAGSGLCRCMGMIVITRCAVTGVATIERHAWVVEIRLVDFEVRVACAASKLGHVEQAVACDCRVIDYGVFAIHLGRRNDRVAL